MEIKVLSKDSRTILMQIIEDISVPQIVHHELLKDDRVVFAGVVQQHPLLKELVMRVQTKSKKPSEVLVSSCLKATEKATNILSEAKKIDVKKEE